MRKLFVVCMICASYMLNAQNDQKADQILNQFSANVKKHKTIQVKFNLSQFDMNNKPESTYAGEILMKGDKFKMIFPGNEICSDGKTIWQYMKELEEVTITNRDKNDESILTNPRRIFVIYKDEFKCRLNQEYQEKGKTFSEIDLFPKKVDKSNFSRIRLKIDKTSLELKSVQYFGKDATKLLIDIIEFKPDVIISDTEFIFDPAKHKNAEINDMRN